MHLCRSTFISQRLSILLVKILAKDRARLSSKSSVAKDSSSDEESLWEDFLTSDSFAFDKEKKDNDDDDAPCGQQAQVQN